MHRNLLSQSGLIPRLLNVLPTVSNLLSEVAGDSLGVGEVLVELLVSLAQEQQQVTLDVSAEDLLRSLVVELDHQRQGLGLNELPHSVDSSFAIVHGLLVVKL